MSKVAPAVRGSPESPSHVWCLHSEESHMRKKPSACPGSVCVYAFHFFPIRRMQFVSKVFVLSIP